MVTERELTDFAQAPIQSLMLLPAILTMFVLFLHDEYNIVVSMCQFTEEKSGYRQLIGRWQRSKKEKTKPNEYDAFVKQKCCIYGSHSGLTGRKSPNPEMAKMKPTKKSTHAHTQYQYNLRIDRKSTIKAAVIKIETLQALSLLKRL